MKPLIENIQKWIGLIVVSVIIAISCSCASILSGRKQNVKISSYPSGARIYVDGRDQGAITPSTVKLPRKKRVELTLQKQGYEDGNIEQGGAFNPVTLTNIVLGGIPGFLVDWATGAIYKYPKDISYTFTTPSAHEDPTIVSGEADNRVTRDNPGGTALERTIIRWYFDSQPQGARLYWRVISSIPDEVKNTNELYLAPTPYEETRSFNILGLTYENSRDVTVEIKVKKAGYMDQVKRFNIRQAIDQQEISSFFELVKAE